MYTCVHTYICVYIYIYIIHVNVCIVYTYVYVYTRIYCIKTSFCSPYEAYTLYMRTYKHKYVQSPHLTHRQAFLQPFAGVHTSNIPTYIHTNVYMHVHYSHSTHRHAFVQVFRRRIYIQYTYVYTTLQYEFPQSFGGMTDSHRFVERWKTLYPKDFLSRDGELVYVGGNAIALTTALQATVRLRCPFFFPSPRLCCCLVVCTGVIQ